jgi:hypothetical protein
MSSSSPIDDPREIAITCITNPPNSRTSGKKGPLTNAEKLQHKENHLCLYYGDGDCTGAKQVEGCPRLQAQSQGKAIKLGNEAPRQSSDSGNITR